MEYWNILVHYRNIIGLLEHYGILWNIIGTLWNIVEYYGILWNIMEYCGILWNIVRFVHPNRSCQP
jgi:hypothetical protein